VQDLPSTLTDNDLDRIKAAIKHRWPNQQASPKARTYLNQFYQCKRRGAKITAKVEGNYGTYTVTIDVREADVSSACSCYIGAGGYCHHCEALALAFLQGEHLFEEIPSQTLERVESMAELRAYLEQTTLASLLEALRRHGVTQKAFAESMGMSSRHLSSMKSSELRNRYHKELGVAKVACLWMLDHIARFGKG